MKPVETYTKRQQLFEDLPEEIQEAYEVFDENPVDWGFIKQFEESACIRVIDDVNLLAV